MNAELLKRLREMTTIGKKIYFKDKKDGTYSCVGAVVDEISVFDERYGYKYFIQKIEYIPSWAEASGSKHGYRFGYYTLNANETRLVWGQYASQMPEAMFFDLIEQANKRF